MHDKHAKEPYMSMDISMQCAIDMIVTSRGDGDDDDDDDGNPNE